LSKFNAEKEEESEMKS
jgi:hypothetical protein